MLFNYLKIALRSIQKQRFYAFINIIGLTVGITASLLIIVFINDELKYDRFHEKANSIYRVSLSGILSGESFNAANSCAPLAEAAQREFPEIEEAVRINQWSNINLTYEEKVITEKRLLLADSNFFSVFTFSLLSGSKEHALKEPNSLVLTESAAVRYFGKEAVENNTAVGRQINIGTDTWLFNVTGIVEDSPRNSHFGYDAIISMNSWEHSRDPYWTSNNLYTYFVLNPQADPTQTEQKMGKLVEKYIGPEIEKFLGLNLQQFYESGGDYGYSLQPMTSIHLHSKLEGELDANGDIVYLYIFSIVALFIIAIACINFMNLSTARSANRAKEVGVRKSVGAHRTSLIGQFLTESSLYSIISALLAFVLIFLLLTPFNTITGKQIGLSDFLDTSLIVGTLCVVFFIGLIAGSYPAFYLTSFRPSEVLKGKIRAGFKSSSIRSTLVVFQFTISIALIVSSLLVFKQLKMIQNHNLGFSEENVIIIQNGSRLKNNKEAFKNDLVSYKDILSVSASNSLPPHIDNNSVFRPLKADLEELIFYNYRTDPEHLETLDMEMVAGRFFSREFPADSNSVIINETALDAIGWENIENQQLVTFQYDEPRPLKVIGVVKDFNFESLKSRIRPLCITFGSGSQISVRMQSGDIQQKIALIESKWEEYAPDSPFEYTFLDENLARLYQSEQRLSDMFIIFTSLAIFIACLGLLGLATFTAEQRSKEIGIRKVLGATSTQLVVLMSKNFTKLIVISIVLAIPVSYIFISKWLDNFAYKTEISPLIFVIAAVLSLMVCWLTVSYQSVKAANANPVDSLKME